MGLSPFKSSSSCYDRIRGTVPKVHSPQTTNVNPDPKNFYIKRTFDLGEYTVVKVRYVGCTNYEGDKILVFKLHWQVVTNLKTLDPHFSKEKPDISPIARFVPTQQGWDMAVNFVKMLNHGQSKFR